jgi:hypothetical protein
MLSPPEKSSFFNDFLLVRHRSRVQASSASASGQVLRRGGRDRGWRRDGGNTGASQDVVFVVVSAFSEAPKSRAVATAAGCALYRPPDKG